MTHEIETGFGTGLRAQLSRKLGAEEAAEAEDVPTVAEQPTEILPLGNLLPLVPEPVVDEPEEIAALRGELERALIRERALREALEHQVEAYERELASARDLAVREAEVEQRVARAEATRAEFEEHQLVLKIQRDQVESERVELARMRAELVSEEARVTELATHMDSRAHELESVHQERAQAGAHLAQQLAGLGERERELRRERAALDAVRQDQENGFLAREESLRQLDAATRQRERTVSERELGIRAAAAELEQQRVRLQERADEVAEREATLERRYDAREKMLANGEAALGAREARLREDAERIERERNGQGQVSQEAFALLAELEQREHRVQSREQRLLESEERIAGRVGQLAQTDEELRLREARLLSEVELREDRLEKRERNVAEREELIEFRERDVSAYVGELQGRINDRNVA
jgi:chromosome segregation ATPase